MPPSAAAARCTPRPDDDPDPEPNPNPNPNPQPLPRTLTRYAAYEKPRKSADRTFVLSHFAGEVIYSIEGKLGLGLGLGLELARDHLLHRR